MINTITNKELLFKALDYTRAGVLITDPQLDDNPIIYANQGFYEMTGYAAPDIIGQNCRFLQGEETDQNEVKRLRDSIKANESCSVTLYNHKKSGEGFWNSLTVDHLYIEEEKKHFFIGVQKDVTREKEIERELLGSQQEIASLACPIVPVFKGVAVLPLIGKVNQERFNHILTITTEEIVDRRLTTIIADLSGVTNASDFLLADLVTLKDVIRMQGANLIITGMSSTIAMDILQTKDLLYNNLQTAGSVQEVIQSLIEEEKKKLD
ncbi:PAS domain-containing protein [Alkalicoccobacillus gibsonii]|uniref:PAS domain-containing protein n=1 Tax=Alkalicoccobacillus gibsonii TaxID=79881 RepID=A0ABU9VDD5_9BACI